MNCSAWFLPSLSCDLVSQRIPWGGDGDDGRGIRLLLGGPAALRGVPQQHLFAPGAYSPHPRLSRRLLQAQGDGPRVRLLPSFFVFFFLDSSVSELVRYPSSHRIRVSCHGKMRAISACSSGEVGSDAVAPTVNPLCFCSIIFLGCLGEMALALDD
jgi:hypothetical protein